MTSYCPPQRSSSHHKPHNESTDPVCKLMCDPHGKAVRKRESRAGSPFHGSDVVKLEHYAERHLELAAATAVLLEIEESCAGCVASIVEPDTVRNAKVRVI